MADKWFGGVRPDQTDISIAAFFRATADNTELTGLTATDITASYWRQGFSRVSITVSDLTNIDDAHSDGGFKEVDSVNMPGLYRFDVPDAAYAAGADWVVVTLTTADGFAFNERFNITNESVGVNQVALRKATAVRNPYLYGRLRLVSGTWPTNGIFGLWGTSVWEDDDWSVAYGTLTDGGWVDGAGQGTANDLFLAFDAQSFNNGSIDNCIVALDYSDDGVTWYEQCRWNFGGIKGSFDGYLMNDGTFAYPQQTNIFQPKPMSILLAPAGTYDANLVAIDGNPTNDNSATLKLKQLDIRGGATDDAVIIRGGDTSGEGIDIQTTNGHGIRLHSYGAGKNAMYIRSTSDAGIMVIPGSNSDGLSIEGSGSGAGIGIYGGSTGNALLIQGNGGDAVRIVTLTEGHGINIEPTGTGKHGIRIAGGTISGNGIDITTTDGHGINLTPNGAGKSGVNILADDGTGIRIAAEGSGRGVHVTSAGGHGLMIEGGAGGYSGVSIYGQGDGEAAVRIANSGAGAGVQVAVQADSPDLDISSIRYSIYELLTQKVFSVPSVDVGLSTYSLTGELNSNGVYQLYSVRIDTNTMLNHRTPGDWFANNDNLYRLHGIFYRDTLGGITFWKADGPASYGDFLLLDNTRRAGEETVWTADTAYTRGQLVSGGSSWHVCDVAGTSGLVEPTWNAAAGDTTVDNGVTWQCISDTLNTGVFTPGVCTVSLVQNGHTGATIIASIPVRRQETDIIFGKDGEPLEWINEAFTKTYGTNIGMDANVIAINGNPTNDYSATLALKQLDIRNTGGDPAVNIASADSGIGVSINSDSNGIHIVTGAGGDGIQIAGGKRALMLSAGQNDPCVYIEGGITSGAGVKITTVDGNGIDIDVNGTDKAGINIVTENGYGIGIESGGNQSGIRVLALDAEAVALRNESSAPTLDVRNLGTGHAIRGSAEGVGGKDIYAPDSDINLEKLDGIGKIVATQSCLGIKGWDGAAGTTVTYSETIPDGWTITLYGANGDWDGFAYIPAGPTYYELGQLTSGGWVQNPAWNNQRNYDVLSIYISESNSLAPLPAGLLSVTAVSRGTSVTHQVNIPLHSDAQTGPHEYTVSSDGSLQGYTGPSGFSILRLAPAPVTGGGGGQIYEYIGNVSQYNGPLPVFRMVDANGAPITGLVAADFTVTVYKKGSITGVVMLDIYKAIVEDANGYYNFGTNDDSIFFDVPGITKIIIESAGAQAVYLACNVVNADGGDANLVSINGNPVTDYSAVLRLRQLDIQSPDDVAFRARGGGANPGAQFEGGETGRGLEVLGGPTSGDGAMIQAPSSGMGLRVLSSNGNPAVRLAGSGTGEGLVVLGGSTADAVVIQGGGTSGRGVAVVTTDGHGVEVASAGTGKVDILATKDVAITGITYNPDNTYNTITLADGRVITFSYAAGQLTGVTYS